MLLSVLTGLLLSVPLSLALPQNVPQVADLPKARVLADGPPHARNFLPPGLVRRLAASAAGTAPPATNEALPGAPPAAAPVSPEEAIRQAEEASKKAQEAGKQAAEAGERVSEAAKAGKAANGTAASPPAVAGEGAAKPAGEPAAAAPSKEAGGAAGQVTRLGVSALTLNAGGDVQLTGMFGSVNFVEGGFKKQDLQYPGNVGCSVLMDIPPRIEHR